MHPPRAILNVDLEIPESRDQDIFHDREVGEFISFDIK